MGVVRVHKRWVFAVVAGWLLAAIAVGPLARGQDGREVRVYPVKHRSAEELLPVARGALAGRGSALPSGGPNAIVLIGPRDAVDAAARVLDSLDRALRSVVLHYESRRSEELRASGVRVLWSAGSGSLRVGNAVFAGGTGARIAASTAPGRGSAQLAGTLRILEGRSGRIATGEIVPVRIRESRRRASTALLHVESGFEAQPRVLGDGRVQVDLSPFEAERVEPAAIRRTAAATTVVLAPGETAVIGCLERSEDDTQLGVLHVASESSRARTVLLLQAELD